MPAAIQPEDLQKVRSLSAVTFVYMLCLNFYTTKLYVTRPSPTNRAIMITYCLGMIGATAKLMRAADPNFFATAVSLGESCYVLAVSLHSSLVLYRLSIITRQSSFPFPLSIRSGLTLAIWALGVVRVLMEFVGSESNSFTYMTFAFYGYVGVIELLAGFLSLKVLYDLKQNLLSLAQRKRKGKVRFVSFESNNGLRLIRHASLILVVQMACMTASGVVYVLNRNRPALAKQIADIFLFVAGHCAVFYSTRILKLVSLKQTQVASESTYSQAGQGKSKSQQDGSVVVRSKKVRAFDDDEQTVSDKRPATESKQLKSVDFAVM